MHYDYTNYKILLCTTLALWNLSIVKRLHLKPKTRDEGFKDQKQSHLRPVDVTQFVELKNLHGLVGYPKTSSNSK